MVGQEGEGPPWEGTTMVTAAAGAKTISLVMEPGERPVSDCASSGEISTMFKTKLLVLQSVSLEAMVDNKLKVLITTIFSSFLHLLFSPDNVEISNFSYVHIYHNIILFLENFKENRH